MAIAHIPAANGESRLSLNRIAGFSIRYQVSVARTIVMGTVHSSVPQIDTWNCAPGCRADSGGVPSQLTPLTHRPMTRTCHR